MTEQIEPDFRVGNYVDKIGGDYTFSGRIVSRFEKTSGAVRYVVEDDRGILHIFSAKMLRLAQEPGGFLED